MLSVFLSFLFIAHSYSSTHQDFYGCAALNILITGRKIWIWAPESSFDYLKSLFPDNVSLDVFNIVEKNKVEMLKHQINWCIQEPGQALYLPPLFGHLVINLEFSISLGMSFIFRSHVDFCLKWVKQQLSSSTDPKKTLMIMKGQVNMDQLFSSEFLSKHSSHTASEISTISHEYSQLTRSHAQKKIKEDQDTKNTT